EERFGGIGHNPVAARPVDAPEDGARRKDAHLALEGGPQGLRRIDRRVQHEAGDLVAKARRVLERDGRTQANAADVMLAEAQSVHERAKKFGMAADTDGPLSGGRLATPRQVGDQDAAVSGKGRTPGMEVLEGADEAVTQEQRMARSLVEVPDPPLPNVDELDVLGIDRGSLLSRVDLRPLQPAAVIDVDRLPFRELVERDGAGLAMAVARILHAAE